MDVAATGAKIAANKGIIINIAIVLLSIFILYKLYKMFSGLFSGGLSKDEQKAIINFPDYTSQMLKAKKEFSKKTGQKTISNTDKPFLFWLSKQVGKTLEQLKEDAATIYDSKTNIVSTDSEDAVFNVLKTYHTKTGIAALTLIFENYTQGQQSDANLLRLITGDLSSMKAAVKKDLPSYLVSFMNESQLKVCTDIIKKLPDFIKV